MHLYSVGDEPIPGYRLTRFLGAGGYGQVWAANGPGGIDIALKIISISGTRGGKELRGIGIVKRVRHPNLVPLIAYWLKDEFGNYIDGSLHEVMSLRSQATELIIAMGLGDMSLAERLAEVRKTGVSGIPLEELLNYVAGAAKAIDFLNQPVHQLGSGQPTAVQHCDIKPGNMLIVGKEVQLCDYGLARAISPDIRVTAATGAGTQAYSAPELLANRPSDHTDQYSLAISYYELRTGQLPFPENEALHAHITGKLDFGLVGVAEQTALARATQLQPEARFPTAGEFVAALYDATNLRASPSGGSGLPAPPSSVRLPIIDDKIRAGAEIVPDHELVCLLGRGGYGEVWKAVGPGRLPVAMKIVRNLEGTQGKQERRSLDLIRELDHEGLIRLRAFWHLAKDGVVIPDRLLGQEGAPEAHALVMATDLAAQNLLQHWQEHEKQGRSGIPIVELVRIIRQSADAIDYLNERDILHRDIKPENILLTKDLKVKISDFGLAKFIEGAGAAIHQASVGLTLAYAAPEMFDNRVSRWTDQYALAISYYRLRTGNFPFPNDYGPRQMMLAHTEGRLNFAGVRPEEERVLRKATDLEPQARFPNCLAMVEALEQGLGLSASVVGTGGSRPSHFVLPEGGSTKSVYIGGRGSGHPPLAATERSLSTAQSDSRTEAAPGAVALAGSQDSDLTAPVSPKVWKTTPGADLLPTVIPEQVLSQDAPRRRPAPTPEIDQVFHAGRRRKRTYVLAAVAGLLTVAAVVAGGVYVLTANRGGPPPSSFAKNEGSEKDNRPPETSREKSGTTNGAVTGGDHSQPAPLEATTEEAVGKALQDGDFVAAANAVKSARGKGVNAAWADKLDERVRTQWRTAALAAKSPEDQLKELRQLAGSYPDDRDVIVQIAEVESKSADVRELKDVFHYLAEHDIGRARDSLAKLKQKSLSAATQARVTDLLAKLNDWDRDANPEPSLPALDALATKYAQEKIPELKALYAEAWDKVARNLVAKLDVAEKPEQVVQTMGRLKGPWAETAKSEAETELLRSGKLASPAAAAPTAEGAPDDLAAYRRYVSAMQSWVANKNDSAADELTALIAGNGGGESGSLSAVRRSRVCEALAEAANQLRQRTDPAVAFANPDRAYRWLQTAERLAARSDSALTKDQLARLQLDLALAALTKPAPDTELGRRLTDLLIQPDKQALLQLPLMEQAQLWAMHARCRETTPAGRLATIRSDTRVFELLRDDLAGMPVHFLASEIVRPLVQDGGRTLLGEPITAEMKQPAARLYADAARNVRRYWGEWSKELNKAQSPSDLALQLFDRAVQLAPAAEYLSWRGFVRLERPDTGAADWDAAEADARAALKADPNWSGGYTLEGWVKALRGKSLSDYRERIRLCREADEEFKKADAFSRPDSRDEVVLRCQRAADNAILLANFATGREQKAKYIAGAKSRAEQLLQLDPTRLEIRDTLGCAIEDEAWLLRGPGRFGPQGQYAQAIDAFDKALGAFGARATPWMHRGRCRYKWAEDRISQGERPDAAQLRDAQSDLREAVVRGAGSAEEAESHFWLAKLEQLRWRDVDERDPKRLTHHAAAAKEFGAALKLARELKADFWVEPVLQEWSIAELDEAERLARLRMPNAAAGAAAAAKVIDQLKAFSPPWYAYMEMLLLPTQFKLEDPAYYAELGRFAQAGLVPGRAQDRLIQYLIHTRLAEAHCLYSTPPFAIDGAQALSHAQAASQLAFEAVLGDDRRAYAIGLIGLARMQMAPKARSNEREALRAKAHDDFENALKLDPRNPAAWQWKVFLAITLEAKENSNVSDAATYFATKYRLFREATPPEKPAIGHEKTIADYLDVARRDLETQGPARIRDALKIDPQNADRIGWELSLAEMLAHSKEVKDVADAQSLFDDTRSGMTPAQQRTCALQIERIRQALASQNGKK